MNVNSGGWHWKCALRIHGKFDWRNKRKNRIIRLFTNQTNSSVKRRKKNEIRSKGWNDLKVKVKVNIKVKIKLSLSGSWHRSTHSYLGTSWRPVVSFMSRTLYLGVAPWYPFNGRMIGPQIRSGGFGEQKSILPLPLFELRTVQPLSRSPKFLVLVWTSNPIYWPCAESTPLRYRWGGQRGNRDIITYRGNYPPLHRPCAHPPSYPAVIGSKAARLYSSSLTSTQCHPYEWDDLHCHSTRHGKAVPLQAWAGPGGTRRFRLPDFMTISTWRWWGCQPCTPTAFTPQ